METQTVDHLVKVTVALFYPDFYSVCINAVIDNGFVADNGHGSLETAFSLPSQQVRRYLCNLQTDGLLQKWCGYYLDEKVSIYFIEHNFTYKLLLARYHALRVEVKRKRAPVVILYECRECGKRFTQLQLAEIFCVCCPGASFTETVIDKNKDRLPLSVLDQLDCVKHLLHLDVNDIPVRQMPPAEDEEKAEDDEVEEETEEDRIKKEIAFIESHPLPPWIAHSFATKRKTRVARNDERHKRDRLAYLQKLLRTKVL